MGNQDSTTVTYINEKDEVVRQVEEEIKRSRKPFSLVIGYARHGKDTFIYNIDPTTIPHLTFGNIKYHFTDSKFKPIEYQNSQLLGENESGFLLNTVGALDSCNYNETEEATVRHILNGVLESVSLNHGILDSIFFIVSIVSDPPYSIVRFLDQLKCAFGDKIFKSMVIIVTKANLLKEIQDVNANISVFNSIAQQYNIAGGVVQFSEDYFKDGNLSYIRSVFCYADKLKTKSDLNDAVKKLKPFSFDTIVETLTQIIKVKASQNIKGKFISAESVVLPYKVLWFLQEKSYEYTNEKYEYYMTKSSKEVLQEAAQEVIRLKG